MKQVSISLKILAGLVLFYAILAAVSVFLPQNALISGFQYPASKPVIALANFAIILILYGGSGYLGYLLSQKTGFPEIWDPGVTNARRFLIPALWGAGVGVFFILSDQLFSRFNTIGPMPHPPFPASLVASFTAAIGEEIIFRLVFISFWVWLISAKILKGKGQKGIFLIVSLISALAFAFGHLPAFMFLYGWKSIPEIPALVLTELVLLNSVMSLFAAWFFRKSGILAAMGIHLWTDITWHCLWGLF